MFFREDEEVSEVVKRHVQNQLPDLLGYKRSVTFRLDLHDSVRLKWLTESLGVHKSVLIRDLLAAAMADAIKELVDDEEQRRLLYSQFERETREIVETGEERDG